MMNEQSGTIKAQLDALGSDAIDASKQLAIASTQQKNEALQAMCAVLDKNKHKILQANQTDLNHAKDNNLKSSLIDRLTLSNDRIDAMINGVKAIVDLDDPIGRKLASWDRPNGLCIERVSVPLGIIAVIYESRPNVTVDAAALCLKSGNCVILRGGSDSFHTSKVLVECIQQAITRASLPSRCVQMLPSKERMAVDSLVQRDDFLDVVVPRGGGGLIKHLQQVSKVPLFMHLSGLCHTYIHCNADKMQAIELVLNAKMRRTGICGATETVLIDKSVAKKILPELTSSLKALGCEIRGDEAVKKICKGVKHATQKDWSTEYLDAIVSIKLVLDINDAILHINHYGSHHTDAIITEDTKAAQTFLKSVNSAIVMHNASTQFADGGEFGMGAEIGIATGKLHARGPVGLEQLTTFNYRVYGQGQIRP
jgi:glutamate-5-semialdehyde dehydrogenase